MNQLRYPRNIDKDRGYYTFPKSNEVHSGTISKESVVAGRSERYRNATKRYCYDN